MDELTNKSATELVALMRARKVSPVEVVLAHLRRIEALNPRLNAVVTLNPSLLEEARAAEGALMREGTSLPLQGLPVTIKDTIDTAGLLTTSGSRLRAGHVPPVDAPAVARLKRAGAIVLGKTNASELAMTYEASNPVFGRTSNPHDLSRTAGGSSGGCAAAISARLSPAGLGSDLMGSIRVPASFCGICGLKPTTGRVSSAGHTPTVAGALSLGATVGPMARRVEDLALMLAVLSGDADGAAVPAPLEASGGAVLNPRGHGVAWYAFDGVATVNEETLSGLRAAMGALADAGFAVREMRPPGVERGPELWTRLFARAAQNYLRRFYEGAADAAGADARFLLKAAEGAPSQTLDDFLAAWNERDYLRAELLRWMEETPLIVAPVGAVQAFEHGARKVRVNEETFGLFRAFSYSQTFNVFGLPAVAVPVGRTRAGLPVGVQVVGRPFAEETVLAAAAIIESALGGFVSPVDFPEKLATETQRHRDRKG